MVARNASSVYFGVGRVTICGFCVAISVEVWERGGDKAEVFHGRGSGLFSGGVSQICSGPFMGEMHRRLPSPVRLFIWDCQWRLSGGSVDTLD